MRRSVVAALLISVLGSLWFAASASASIGHAKTGENAPLADGFRVAQGTRLVGEVFPVIAYSPGWTAYLDVTTDGVSAFNAYADQAAALGYQQSGARCVALDGSASATSSDSAAGVACEGSYYRPANGGTLNIAVNVCGSCLNWAQSVAVLLGGRDGGPTPSFLRPVSPVAGPVVQLDDAQRAAMEESRKAANRSAARGELPDYAPEDIRVISPTLAGVKGSVLLAPQWVPGGIPCSPDSLTLFRVSGDPDDVLDAFRERIDSLPREKPITRKTSRAEWRGWDATETRDGDWTFTLLEPDRGGRDPLLLATLCGD